MGLAVAHAGTHSNWAPQLPDLLDALGVAAMADLGGCGTARPGASRPGIGKGAAN